MDIKNANVNSKYGALSSTPRAFCPWNQKELILKIAEIRQTLGLISS